MRVLAAIALVALAFDWSGGMAIAQNCTRQGVE